MSSETTSPIVSEPTSASETISLPSSSGDELTQVQEAAKALVEALKNLATTQMQIVGSQVQTVGSQVQSIGTLPQTVLQSIEAAIKDLQVGADKSWQDTTTKVTDIEDRLSRAAKAAWEVLATPKDSSTPPDSIPDQDP